METVEAQRKEKDPTTYTSESTTANVLGEFALPLDFDYDTASGLALCGPDSIEAIPLNSALVTSFNMAGNRGFSPIPWT